jgi:REP element-mobilizing transposase RayT
VEETESIIVGEGLDPPLTLEKGGRKKVTYYARKSARIPNYDYASYNYYFVTICTHNRRCIFGSPEQLNEMGTIAWEEIQKISLHYNSIHVDHFVVMPNHIHMIVILEGNGPNLNQVIAQYKSGVTRKIREIITDISVWQRSYHDHVIRNQREYEKIWNYIEGNPSNWNKDCFFVASAQYHQV